MMRICSEKRFSSRRKRIQVKERAKSAFIRSCASIASTASRQARSRGDAVVPDPLFTTDWPNFAENCAATLPTSANTRPTSRVLNNPSQTPEPGALTAKELPTGTKIRTNPQNNSQKLSRLSSSLNPPEQVANTAFKGFGDARQSSQSNFMLCTLDISDVIASQVSLFGQLFLAQASLAPSRTNGFAQNAVDFAIR